MFEFRGGVQGSVTNEFNSHQRFSLSCHRPFLFLQPEPEEHSGKPAVVTKRTRNELRGDAELVKLLRTSVEQTSEDDGWAHLGRVGLYISNNSSFSPVNHGYRKLSDLIKASELFIVDMRDNTTLYIKDAR